MANDVHSFLVVLKDSTNDEDAEEIAKAIRMIKGVIEVTPNEVDIAYKTARLQTRNEFRQKIWEALEVK